ncbi:hypothetical protein RFI_23618 [Reticulomyxa filosa]|uniref:PPM-type phosphatase domain-containing protein n=1 Tax=Reticulomyxa filosa TaxID=46433 RepID=X6MJX0_RETFI|nr:hypothetical protein RFI_23618 [Reticulomyxa filosa]|eukprot:ETO13752.1 hypothetical protein RFI_23618 [Reticulomyxa filosa]
MHRNKYMKVVLFDNLFYKKVGDISQATFRRQISKIYPAQQKKVNQDIYFCHYKFGPNKDCHLFGVCDGHGEYGHRVSQYVAKKLPKNILNTEFQAKPMFRMQLKKKSFYFGNFSFKQPDLLCSKNDYSGTTLVFSLFVNDVIYTANLGDSRAVLLRQKNKTHNASIKGNNSNKNTLCQIETKLMSPKNNNCADIALQCFFCGKKGKKNLNYHLKKNKVNLTSPISKNEDAQTKWNAAKSPIADIPFPTNCQVIALSRDHKPDIEEEMKRIVSHGGRVKPLQGLDDSLGPSRVWLTDIDIPGLAMSRSLGDDIAHTVGVSSEVEISVHRIDSTNDLFIIYATDGIWEFISNAQATAIVNEHFPNLRAGAMALAKLAIKKWRKEEDVVDDITAIIYKIQPD